MEKEKKRNNRDKNTKKKRKEKRTLSFLKKNRIGNGTERLSWIGRVGMVVLSAEVGIPYPDPEHQPMRIVPGP